MANTKETLLFSAAVAFFIMWLSELFRAIPFTQNYVWLMFSIVCLLYFQYSKNERLKNEDKSINSNQTPPKKKKK